MSYVQTTPELDIRAYQGRFDSAGSAPFNRTVLTLPNRAGWGFLTKTVFIWLDSPSTWLVSPAFALGINAPNFDNLLGAAVQLGTDPAKYRPYTPLASGPAATNQPIILPPGSILTAHVTTAGMVSSGTPFVGVIILGVWIQVP